MKYPQLVSTRAVNAISDWLVTQLEQLGVDASSVYSRLLLSLLHTPLQINALDLAEISDNKVGNITRNKSVLSKGNGGTHFRRFSAADTEALKRLAAIDSLLEAVPSDQQLSKIENLVDELSLKLREIEEQNGLDDSVFEINQHKEHICDHKIDSIEQISEASDDPAKRYFRAFPALSNQSRNDYSNHATSWPHVKSEKNRISVHSESRTSALGANVIREKSKRRRIVNITSSSASSLTNQSEFLQANPIIQSKNIPTSTRNCRVSNSGRTSQKKKSSEMWDTDFNGAWEMGRDLIREFVLKQNIQNRSISESASATLTSFENANLAEFQSQKLEPTFEEYERVNKDEENLMRTAAAAATSALFGNNFGIELNVLNCPKSRDISSSSLVHGERELSQSKNFNFQDCNEAIGKDYADLSPDETHRLAAFEAKFDHNVEALWNDAKNESIGFDPNQLNKQLWLDQHNNASYNKSNEVKMMGRDLFNVQQNNLNSSNSVGAMNLISSIWADNIPNNNEEDVSFYSHTRIWETNPPTEHIYNNSTKPHEIYKSNINLDVENYTKSAFSKWSEVENPFISIQQEARMTPRNETMGKIRDKSCFPNYQSMINSNNENEISQSVNDSCEYFAQAQNTMKRGVTLVNHSSKSLFKEVAPLPFEIKQELAYKNNAHKYHTSVINTADHEDLLTSERTRFRPIKQTYVDGFTFEISNKLDQINYERSQSGMLYHDSEVYREYFVYDEEGNGGSRCDIDNNSKLDFTLKYCVRQNDIGCQTDGRRTLEHRVISPSSFVSQNMNAECQTERYNSINNGSSLRNVSPRFQNNELSVPVFSGNDFNHHDWNSGEIRHCCNNNNNNNNTHALWEHCATCSNNVISMPANNLLREELSADGDEIMSDLKYLIQSISFQSNWEEGDSDNTFECESNISVQAPVTNMTEDYSDSSNVAEIRKWDDRINSDLTSNHIYSNVNKLISDLLQPEKAQTMVQAISEKCQSQLLVDDRISTIHDPNMKRRIISNTKDIQATKYDDLCNSPPTIAVSNNSCSHFGGLWAYNDNSIWRKELPTDLEFRRSVEVKSIDKLSEHWEHANLEEIWSRIPTVQSLNQVNNGNNMNRNNSIIFLKDERVPNKQTSPDFAKQTKEEKFIDFLKKSSAVAKSINQNEKLQKNVTRYDRKRRHSATSQNYFDQLHYTLTDCDTIKRLATKTVSDFGGDRIFGSDANPLTTTIITCKYWTECESICLTINNNNNIVGSTEDIFNCYHKLPEKILSNCNGNETITMHPILKQVAAMVSRPLTR